MGITEIYAEQRSKNQDNAQPKDAAVADDDSTGEGNGGTVLDRKGAQPHKKGGMTPDVNMHNR